MPKVSILIPVYNTEIFLSQTIESVLNQTFTDWELIILDDCSTDESFSIAQDFVLKDKRIKSFRNEQNLGMMRNWNKGISLCQSELYAKLDADDLWHPCMLEESLRLLEDHPESVMACTNYINIDALGNSIDGTESSMPGFAKNKPFSCIPLVQSGAEKMLQHNVLRQGVSIIKRGVFDEIGLYRLLESEDTQASVDTEMYFRIGCHYKILGIDKTLYKYRIHQKSISETDRITGLQDKKIYEVKRAIMKYYFIQKKLSKAAYKKSIREVKFLRNTNLIYEARFEKEYRVFTLKIIECFFTDPFKTFRFCWKRFAHYLTLKNKKDSH